MAWGSMRPHYCCPPQQWRRTPRGRRKRKRGAGWACSPCFCHIQIKGLIEQTTTKPHLFLPHIIQSMVRKRTVDGDASPLRPPPRQRGPRSRAGKGCWWGWGRCCRSHRTRYCSAHAPGRAGQTAGAPPPTTRRSGGGDGGRCGWRPWWALVLLLCPPGARRRCWPAVGWSMTAL